jgi:hypothetical protein
LAGTLASSRSTALRWRSIPPSFSRSRNAVDRLEASVPANLAVYTGLIAEALGAVRGVAQIAADPAIGARVSALSAFLSLKEFAGQERAAASAVFAAGAIDGRGPCRGRCRGAG